MHLYERLNYLTAKQIDYNLHFKQPVLSIKGSVIKLEAKRKKTIEYTECKSEKDLFYNTNAIQ